MQMLVSGPEKIRIFSKKLPSGKCQVKFYITTHDGSPYYGYLLVEPGNTVRHVIEIILEKIKEMERPEEFYHKYLFNVGKRPYLAPDFMLFNYSDKNEIS